MCRKILKIAGNLLSIAAFIMEKISVIFQNMFKWRKRILKIHENSSIYFDHEGGK